jgi:hypothetical protein
MVLLLELMEASRYPRNEHTSCMLTGSSDCHRHLSVIAALASPPFCTEIYVAFAFESSFVKGVGS